MPAQLPNPLRVLSKTQPVAEVMGNWLDVMSDWWLAIGDWQLVIGNWWLAIGYGIWAAKPHIRAFTLYTLSFTLLAPAPLPLTFRLIASFTCLLAVFWRRCRRQMQERYEVARVKTETLDRREINSANCSKNIVIVFGATLSRRMRAREMDKTGAVKSYLNGLWISHLSGDA